MENKYNLSENILFEMFSEIIKIKYKLLDSELDSEIITVFGYLTLNNYYLITYCKYSNKKNVVYRIKISFNEFDLYNRKIKLKKLNSVI